MGWDASLIDPETKHVVMFDEAHFLRGGTFRLGGTQEAWLSVTYNYGPHFKAVLHEAGLRGLDGMMASDSIPLLTAAIDKLKDDKVPANYWRATEGNARQALCYLRLLAEKRPDAVWSIS